MKILAIDPGCDKSAYVLWDGDVILAREILPNFEMVCLTYEYGRDLIDHLAIEEIASYGMAVGKEVFRTCFWGGRFAQQWFNATCGREAQMIERRVIKQHHCYSARATDANIRQALIDRFGAPGKKAAPGLLYPLKSHTWAAFALAVYVHDTETVAARLVS